MKEKIRHSGHLVDQKLKTINPSIEHQASFEILLPETQNKMGEQFNIRRAYGIRLNPAQDKLINALLKLLHEKSENKDVQSKAFYAGNDKPAMVPYGGRMKKAQSAIIRIFPTELYKAYLGSDDYSGADVKFIIELLLETARIKYLIIYEKKRVSKEHGLEVRTDRIEDFQSLYKILPYFADLSEEEGRKLDMGSAEIRKRKGELIIALNPLLTDEIQSKYVEYPADINRRTVIAAGGHRQVTESMVAFRDYMLREKSAKRFDFEINEETLLQILRLEKYVAARRRKLIQQKITDVIQFGKNLQLIESFDRVIGAKGQWKYIFHLNPSFE